MKECYLDNYVETGLKIVIWKQDDMNLYAYGLGTDHVFEDEVLVEVPEEKVKWLESCFDEFLKCQMFLKERMNKGKDE